MGFNSVLVILNDHLHTIRDDPHFGRKVYDAIVGFRFADAHIGNAGRVISVAHADHDQLVSVGGNLGAPLPPDEGEGFTAQPVHLGEEGTEVMTGPVTQMGEDDHDLGAKWLRERELQYAAERSFPDTLRGGHSHHCPTCYGDVPCKHDCTIEPDLSDAPHRVPKRGWEW